MLKLKSLLAGEYAENEFRKQFTPSEREAIARAIEADLLKEERRGRPEKNPAIAGNKQKGESIDIAAKSVGFSAETYERAKTVVARGAPEVIRAMDSGEVSVAAAATIATQPKADQLQSCRQSLSHRD